MLYFNEIRLYEYRLKYDESKYNNKTEVENASQMKNGQCKRLYILFYFIFRVILYTIITHCIIIVWIANFTQSLLFSSSSSSSFPFGTLCMLAAILLFFFSTWQYDHKIEPSYLVLVTVINLTYTNEMTRNEKKTHRIKVKIKSGYCSFVC